MKVIIFEGHSVDEIIKSYTEWRNANIMSIDPNLVNYSSRETRFYAHTLIVEYKKED